MRGRSHVDLILAGDVLGYVGELRDVFKSAGAALRQGGYFLFSVEKPTAEEGEGLILRRTRRFAHSRSYIEERAREAGMEVAEVTDAVLRMDNKLPIDGLVFVLRKL